MNLKILGSLLTLALASTALGYGTFAFFSDTETAAQNLFTAGDLDLTIDDEQGTLATITGTNFAPGDTVSGSLVLHNKGSITTADGVHAVDLDFKAATIVTDDPGNPNDIDDGGQSLVAFDRWLTLTSFTYDGQSLLGQIGDKDGDGRSNTLSDLGAANVFKDLADPGASGKTLALTVTFATDGPNYLKRDSVDVSFTFFLAQAGEVDLS